MLGAPPDAGSSRWLAAAAASLIVVFGAQVHWSVGRKSAILHETLYTYAGYQYLVRGAYDVNFDSPPLLKQLAALPLLPLRLDPGPDPATTTERRERRIERFLYENRVPADAILARARAPFLLFALLLGVVVHRWAAELYGRRAALLALWLFAFNPALLAEAGFANHDFGLTSLSVATLYAFWCLCRRPTPATTLVAGVALGLALVTKFSALGLVPAVLVLGLGDVLVHRPPGGLVAALGRRLVLLAGVLGLAALVVWADYGFETGALVLEPWRRVAERLAPGGLLPALLARAPDRLVLPAPTFVQGAAVQSVHGAIGHVNYLFGEVSSRGWWYYYLVTLLYRAPIPLLLLGLARAVTWRPAGGARAWAEAWPLLYTVLTLVLFSASRTQLGQRYVLVVYPLCFVLAAGLVAPPAALGRAARVALGVCLVWYAAAALGSFPDYLTYFNALAGGPDRGWRKVLEGVDLGQDARGLVEFAEARDLPLVKVSCFGCPPARYLGPRFAPLPCGPTDGWLAVSVRSLVMPEPFLPRGCFAWLAGREPAAVIGHTIHVWHVEDADP